MNCNSQEMTLPYRCHSADPRKLVIVLTITEFLFREANNYSGVGREPCGPCSAAAVVEPPTAVIKARKPLTC